MYIFRYYGLKNVKDWAPGFIVAADLGSTRIFFSVHQTTVESILWFAIHSSAKCLGMVLCDSSTHDGDASPHFNSVAPFIGQLDVICRVLTGSVCISNICRLHSPAHQKKVYIPLQCETTKGMVGPFGIRNRNQFLNAGSRALHNKALHVWNENLTSAKEFGSLKHIPIRHGQRYKD